MGITKPCFCGCGQLIPDKDKYGRKHDYVLGHSTKGKYHYWNAKGDKHYNWNGGRSLNSQGYVMVKCEGHPRARKSYRYRVREHILVMEKHLGRYLHESERVHHKNGDKTDNRLANLELTNPSDHSSYHSAKNYREGKFSPEFMQRVNGKRDPATGRFY